MDYNVNRGDICWIAPGDFERGGENTIRSDRPAIIVSNEEINEGNYNFMVVFLTTRPKRDEKTHVTIRSSSRMSTALCEQITTVSSEQIGKYIGTCTIDEMEAVDRACIIALGIEETSYEPDANDGEEDICAHMAIENEALMYDLEKELIEARTRADTIMKMYNELLEKTLDR